MYLQALKTKINGHDEDLNVFDETIQDFMKITDQKFQRTTMTQNNPHLTNRILTKVFTAYTKDLRNYMGFMTLIAEHLKIFSQH